MLAKRLTPERVSVSFEQQRLRVVIRCAAWALMLLWSAPSHQQQVFQAAQQCGGLRAGQAPHPGAHVRHL